MRIPKIAMALRAAWGVFIIMMRSSHVFIGVTYDNDCGSVSCYTVLQNMPRELRNAFINCMTQEFTEPDEDDEDDEDDK